MNVAIVSYHGFASNSGGHIACLANALVQKGVHVTVFVPFGSDATTLHGDALYSCRLYSELDDWLATAGGSPSRLLVIAWTPRENVRQFVGELRSKVPCKYVVHLEDNENVVTSINLGVHRHQLERMSPEELNERLSADSRLSHPHHFPQFIAESSGVTALMDTLSLFAKPGQPFHVSWPGFNNRFFFPRAIDFTARRRLGIGDKEIVVTYTGNVHNANRREVLSLYLAILILNRRGIPARLIRTGDDYVPVLDDGLKEIRSHVIELGSVATQSEVAHALSMANALVQPGRCDDFNDFRFPSKLPEFFAMGRPVLLPATNVGRFVRDRVDCIVLQRGDAADIATNLEMIHADPGLSAALSKNAVDFAQRHFRWDAIAEDYLLFLQTVAQS
ncbi:MAG: glycosyltransferase family 4 protein [Opitutaceae bacterium]